jgi:glycosyltransferase involved in cell wall biosynthesis
VLIIVENASIPYDRRVTEEARALLANGYSVSIICPAAPVQVLGYQQAPRECLEGIEVRRYRELRARGGALSQVVEYLNALVKSLWLMVTMMRRPGFDVIQVCNPPDLLCVIAWPFTLFGKRFIFDQHDLSPELYSTLYSRDSGLILRVLRLFERASYALADAVIVCNQSYRHLALSRGGVPPERVFVVRNGPRDGWPKPLPVDHSLKRGRPFLVLYVGVMNRQDGVDVLLHAARALVHEMQFRDATFALVGNGGELESLKAQATALDIEEYVDFTGWITDEDRLSTYLRSADACVCPEPSSPLNDQSTFIKVMEYMAAGIPMVAFDLPETRVSAGGAAVYSPPGDVRGFAERIKAVLTNQTLASEMSAAAAERLPSLLWEGQIPNLLAAYAHAMSDNPR